MVVKKLKDFKKHIAKDIFENSLTFDELEGILSKLPSNIYLKDAEGKYIFATHYWHHLDHGDDENWTIRGKTDYEIRKDKENALMAMEKDKEIIATGKGAKYVIEINTDNTLEYFEIIKEAVYNADGRIIGIVGLINDVTHRELLQKELNRLALIDQLTGLKNRNCFLRDIENFDRADFPLAFGIIDCNDLKIVNDTYGHEVGDEYIKIAGIVLKLSLPKSSKVYRIGGDEFIVTIPNTSEEQIEQLAKNFDAKSKTYSVNSIDLSIAYGFAMANSPDENLKQVLDEADKRMYENKAQQKALLHAKQNS